jgi:hypothetical protein
MQRFYKATGITHVAADAHMHTAVGCCERFNASLRAMARAAYFDSAFQWDVWLPLIELFYAARPQSSLAGYSPFFLDTGRSPRLPWDLVYSASLAEAPRPRRPRGAEEKARASNTAAAPAASDEAAEPPASDAVGTAESDVKAARDARRERRAANRQAALDRSQC